MPNSYSLAVLGITAETGNGMSSCLSCICDAVKPPSRARSEERFESFAEICRAYPFPPNVTKHDFQGEGF